MQNIIEFLKCVNEDQSLRNEIGRKEKLFGLKTEQTKESYKSFLEKDIIPIAKKRGFLFTADDYMNFISNNGKKILSEDQLEEVAGGRGGFFLPVAMAAISFFQG